MNLFFQPNSPEDYANKLPMAIIDIVLVVLLALSAIQGYRKGFIHSITSLLALILGIYLAFYFSDVTADFIREILGLGGKYLNMIAFVLTLVLVVVVVSAIGKIIEKVMETIMLGFLNSLAGAVFGLLKGVLVLSLFMMLLGYLKVEDKLISKEKQQAARFYEGVKEFAPFVLQKFKLDQKLKDLDFWNNESHDESKPEKVTAKA